MGLVDDALEYMNRLADEFGFDKDDPKSGRDDFINEGMARKGFKQVTAWAEPDPEETGGKVRSMMGGRKTGTDGKAPFGYGG